MAKGVNATKADASGLITRGEVQGKEYFVTDVYVANTFATGAISMCPKFPKNALLTSLDVETGALGASVTMIAGVSGDTDAFVATPADVSAAAKLTVIPTVLPYSISEEQIVLTTAGAATTAANRNIVVRARYVIQENS